jgi:nucleoside-diphosphate-sugar epimerase
MTCDLKLGSTLITGGTGFLGRHLVDRLLAQDRAVAVLARRPAPDLTARGVRVITADLADEEAVRSACCGIETVFHVAAKVGVWGRYRDFHRANVLGTRAVLAGCRAHGVQRLVFTSTPSVVYNGRDLAGADESLPLTTRCPAAYPLTKAIAEREVLAANSPELRTVALRPHLIWGAGDPHLVPRIIAQARAGRLRIVGTGRNRVDMVHVHNAVDAHLLAELALGNKSQGSQPGSQCNAIRDKETAPPSAGRCNLNSAVEASTPRSGERQQADSASTAEFRCNVIRDQTDPLQSADGRAYFITNGEPVVLWDWINDLLRALDIPPVTKRLPLGAATVIGAACEALWGLLPLRSEPPMTRFVAKELASDHWFDISAARRDLGYAPRISMAEGTAELIASLRRTSAL